LTGAREFIKPTLWWALGLLLVLLICVASLVRVPQLEVDLPRYADKWQHVVAYFAVMGWFSQLIARKSLLFKAALAFFTMGVVLEFLQGLTGYRSLDVFDVAANSTGILLGLVIAFTPLTVLIQWLDRRLFSLQTKPDAKD